jgi:hypothetical protein
MARNKQRPITAEELEQIKGIIIYDPETGYLHGKQDGRKRGSLHPSGYRRVSIIGRDIYEHRLAWALYYGEDPYPLEIDHINRNRSDNVISNLRRVTPAEQNMNRTNTRHEPKPPTRTQSEAAFNRWANTTAEERRQLALRRWEVRRQKNII